MLYDARRRRLILDRSWPVYDLITASFQAPDEFHGEFPAVAQLAAVTGFLQATVQVSPQGRTLSVNEEYDFQDYDLVVRLYSYGFFDAGGHTIIRADCLPYHQVDYRGRQLPHFPHHLHDEAGRVCSFDGDIRTFIKRSAEVLSRMPPD